MKRLKYNKAARLNLVLTVLLLMLSACIMIVSVYARYETSLDDSELNMQAASGSVYIYGDDNFAPLNSWIYNDETGEYTVDVVISNAENAERFCMEDQSASLKIFATLGIANPESISIKLIADNEEYTAVPAAVEKNTPLHISYGDGWVFRFYNAAGEELKWTLRGNEVSTEKITVIISGNTAESASLSLILSGNVI